jgi:hypothetical protein
LICFASTRRFRDVPTGRGEAVCAFASAWTDREIVQAPLAQSTWYHHLALIEKLDDKAARLLPAGFMRGTERRGR